MSDRTAVITGASQGLGLELAKALAAGGWSLVIDARRADRLEGARRAIAAVSRPDVTVEAVAGDVTDDSHLAAVAAAAARLGSVGLVVNNASTLGASPLPALDAITPEVLRRVFDVNVVAPVALIQHLVPLLGEGAVIVNVTSDASTGVYEGWGGYGASKAALDHASRILGAEHPQWRVYAVDPGDMRTEMHQDAFPGEDISDRADPADAVAPILTLIESRPPSGRYEAKAFR